MLMGVPSQQLVRGMKKFGRKKLHGIALLLAGALLASFFVRAANNSPASAALIQRTNMTAPTPGSVTIPLDFTRGRALAQVTVNGKPLWFLLDTGYGVDTIHPDLVETLGLVRKGHLTIVGIAGEE